MNDETKRRDAFADFCTVGKASLTDEQRDALSYLYLAAKNTRDQASAPDGFEKELRDFLLKEMPRGTVIGSPVYWAKRIAGRVHLLTRSNAKAVELVPPTERPISFGRLPED